MDVKRLTNGQGWAVPPALGLTESILWPLYNLYMTGFNGGNMWARNVAVVACLEASFPLTRKNWGSLLNRAIKITGSPSSTF